MRATAEIRWFYPGDIPEAAAAWFDAFGPHSEPARTDLYLHPTDAAMNVKWRQGQMEAKRRDAEGTKIVLGEEIIGVVERWRKWSFALEEEAKQAEHPLWLPVQKFRRMKSYRLDGSRRVVPVPEDDTPDSGCEVELATLDRAGESWWSLCFEAYGEEAQLRALLEKTTALVFSEGFPVQLEARQSYGYAAWLLAT